MGRRRKAWYEGCEANAPILFAFFLIVYTTAIGSTCDFGENNRFKFMVEPLVWPFLAAVFMGRRLKEKASVSLED